MKRLAALVVSGALAASILVSCGEKAQEAAQPQKQVTSVVASVVSSSDRVQVRSYTGTLEGEQQSFVYARLDESIEKIHVAVGDKVRANEILVSLDKDGPTSSYNEARAPYLNAEKLYKKMEYLYKEGAISETEFDRSKTEYETAKARFDAVARTVDVRTPIAGEVTSIDVSPGDFVGRGQRLATVASVGKLRVRFGVNREEISAFSIGSEVFATSENARDTLSGTIVKVARSADPVTRTFEVEALLDNSEGTYRPGVFVKVLFVLERFDNVLTVPRQALLNLDDEYVVFVVANGTAERRSVAMGADIEGHVIITSGLNPGDTLVTLGQDYLADGDDVFITELKEIAR